MIDKPNMRRGRGRPEKTEDEKLTQLRYGVTPATLARFEALVAKAGRSEFLEQALILMMDIKEGKRILPPLEK